MKENMELQEVKTSKKNPRRLLSLMMAVMMIMSLAVAASATDGTTEQDTVINSFDTLASLMTKVLSMITSNWLLTLFLGAGLLGLGITVFKRVKRGAR